MANPYYVEDYSTYTDEALQSVLGYYAVPQKSNIRGQFTPDIWDYVNTKPDFFADYSNLTLGNITAVAFTQKYSGFMTDFAYTCKNFVQTFNCNKFSDNCGRPSYTYIDFTQCSYSGSNYDYYPATSNTNPVYSGSALFTELTYRESLIPPAVEGNNWYDLPSIDSLIVALLVIGVFLVSIGFLRRCLGFVLGMFRR